MSDTISIKLDASKAIRNAKLLANSLDKVEKEGEQASGALKKTGAAAKGMASSFGKLKGALIGAGLGTAFVTLAKSIFEATQEYERFQAMLVTSTGSVVGAAEAFEFLNEFTKTVPFSLAEVTQAFIQMKNLGLDPSERALSSYSDTASAMGKSLNQMVEAVADAVTGEYERLKEFGIKSKSEGDKITFTFRKVKTTIKNDAASIERYLINLGEVNFGGSAIRMMETLGGKVSNLGVAWDTMLRDLSQSGIGDAIKDGVDVASSMIENLSATLRNVAFAEEWKGYFDEGLLTFSEFAFSFGTAQTELLEKIRQNKYLKAAMDKEANVELKKNLDAEAALQANLNARLKILYAEKNRDSAASIAIQEQQLKESIAKSQAIIAEMGRGIPMGPGREFMSDSAKEASKLNTDLELQREEAARQTEEFFKGEIRKGETYVDMRAKMGDREVAITQAHFKRIKEINELKAAGDLNPAQYADLIVQSQKRMDAELIALKKSEAATQASGQKKIDTKVSQQRTEFDNLVDSLRTEEEAIQESYTRRLQIILLNTEKGSQAQADLKARLDAQFAEEVTFDFHGEDTYTSELAAIQEFYASRHELIMSNVHLTEEARTELELRLIAERNSRIQELEMQRVAMVSQAGEFMFGEMADLYAAFANDTDSTYRALFAASKAFAIAEATVNMWAAVSKAWNAPAPLNFAQVASVMGAMGGVFSAINSATYHDEGGKIAAGKFGIVGEKGIELISGGQTDSFSTITQPQKDSYKELVSVMQLRPSVANNETMLEAENALPPVKANEIISVGQDGPRLVKGPVSVISRKETAKYIKELKTNNFEKLIESAPSMETLSSVSKTASINQDTTQEGASSSIAQSTSTTRQQETTNFIKQLKTNNLEDNKLVSIFNNKHYAGAFDSGGTIPSGSFGMINEKGFELVEGPAKVTGREDTSRMFQQLTDAVNGLQQQQTNIRIINSVDQNMMDDYMGSDPAEKKIMNMISRNGATIQQLVA